MIKNTLLPLPHLGARDENSKPTQAFASTLTFMSTETIRYTIPERYYDKDHRGWAFPTWVSMHAIADKYPVHPSLERQKAAYEYFARELPLLLPCDKCGRDLAEAAIRDSIDVSSGPKLSAWLYKFHNDERAKRGLPTFTLEQCKIEQELYRSLNWGNVMADLKAVCREVDHSPTSNGAVSVVAGNPFLAGSGCVSVSSSNSTHPRMIEDGTQRSILQTSSGNFEQDLEMMQKVRVRNIIITALILLSVVLMVACAYLTKKHLDRIVTNAKSVSRHNQHHNPHHHRDRYGGADTLR